MSTHHDELGRRVPGLTEDEAADVLDFLREGVERRPDLEPLSADVTASLDRIAADCP